MQKKYIVVGRKVRSQSDGERHYVSSRKLCDLYHINPDECILLDMNSPRYQSRLRGLPADLPVLGPRSDGDYRVDA